MNNYNQRPVHSGTRPEFNPQLASGSFPTQAPTNPRTLFNSDYQRIVAPSQNIGPTIHEMNKQAFHNNSNLIQGTNYAPGSNNYRPVRPQNNVQGLFTHTQTRPMNPNVNRLGMSSGGHASSMSFSQASMSGPAPATVPFPHNFQNAASYSMTRPINNTFSYIGPYFDPYMYCQFFPQMTMTQSNPVQQPKKEKKVLTIINPETNANVLEEFAEERKNAGAQEEPPKEILTGQPVNVPPNVPQVTNDDTVAAEFTLKVVRSIAVEKDGFGSVYSANDDVLQESDLTCDPPLKDDIMEKSSHNEENIEPSSQPDQLTEEVERDHSAPSSNDDIVCVISTADNSELQIGSPYYETSTVECSKSSGNVSNDNSAAWTTTQMEDVESEGDNGRPNKHKKNRVKEIEVTEEQKDLSTKTSNGDIITTTVEQTEVVLTNEEIESLSIHEEKKEVLNSDPQDPTDKQEPSELTEDINESENDAGFFNQTGRKQYDRTFLLKFQTSVYSLKKPEGLPSSLKIIIKDTPNKPHAPRKPNIYDFNNEPPDFAPNYVKSANKGSITRNRSQPGRGRAAPKVLDIKLSINEKVELREAENAWKPSKMTDAPPDDKSLVQKQVRGILNKLTPQKFDTLVEKLKGIVKEHGETFLDDIIELVFDKSVEEPKFSSSYAKMCAKLSEQLKDSSASKFREKLLNKCQREFESEEKSTEKMEQLKTQLTEETDADKEKELKLLIEEQERKIKRRSLGIIRFIGELFKEGMLKLKVMHQCVMKLIREIEDEDSVECLCRLMTTMGAKFDTASPVGFTDVNQYFLDMENTSKKKTISSRTRFMIQDVLDLRKNKWVPRREENNPKLKEEIKLDYQNELYQKSVEMSVNNSNYGSYRKNDDRKRKFPEWDKRPQASRNPIAMDKLAHELSSSTLKLHPQKNMSWSAGSSFNGRNLNKQAEAPTAPGGSQLSTHNKFSLLNKMEESAGRSQAKTPGKESKVRTSNSLGRESKIVKSHPEGGPLDRLINDHSKSRSKSSSRDNSVSRDSGPSPPSAEEAAKQTRLLMEEYWVNVKPDDAKQCIKETFTTDTTNLYVSEALNLSLEKTFKDMTNTGRLFATLLNDETVSWPQFLKGVHELLVNLPDLLIDIPKADHYLASILEPIYSQNDVLPLNTLSTVLKPVIKSPHAKTIVAALLNKLVESKGVTEVKEMWVKSGLQWSEFLDMKTQTEFIKSQNLDFTIQPGPPGQRNLSPDEVVKKLAEKLRYEKFDSQSLISWLKDNISNEEMRESSFVRALTYTCMECSIEYDGESMHLNEAKMNNVSDILKSILSSRQSHLKCLISIQALVHKLNHPSGLLVKIFAALLDNEVLTEESIFEWEKDSSAENAGKAVALKAVHHFLSQLRSHEDESDSN